jgi:hypothetical protein
MMGNFADPTEGNKGSNNLRDVEERNERAHRMKAPEAFMMRDGDMQTSSICDRYVISCENNVVRVDFARPPDPPPPQFPGAGALRIKDQDSQCPESARPISPPQPSSVNPTEKLTAFLKRYRRGR